MENFNTSVKALVGAALLASAGMASAVNIVVNPSFELGNFDDLAVNGTSTDKITQVGGAQPNNKITGWTVSNSLIWIDNGYTAFQPTNPPLLLTPYGSKFLDLTAFTNVQSQYGSIAQNLSTQANTQYTLSFSLGASTAYGLLPVIAVSTAGVVVNFSMTAAPTAASNWTTFSYQFATGAGQTTIPITFTGIQGSDFIGLDNVSVTAVPEPGSLAMLLAGVAAVGAVVARKRNQIV